jgi:hypothetical protein
LVEELVTVGGVVSFVPLLFSFALPSAFLFRFFLFLVVVLLFPPLLCASFLSLVV